MKKNHRNRRSNGVFIMHVDDRHMEGICKPLLMDILRAGPIIQLGAVIQASASFTDFVAKNKFPPSLGASLFLFTIQRYYPLGEVPIKNPLLFQEKWLNLQADGFSAAFRSEVEISLAGAAEGF